MSGAVVKRRTAILMSGRGSNMAALIEAAAAQDFPVEIVGVLSDQPQAPGLVLAERLGIPLRAVERRDYANKDLHDAAIDEVLSDWGTEIVCLAGYMRLLTPGFVDKWQGKMINIHPALLPAFKGLDTHRRALETGVRVHGCTVHFVTSEMDAGPIIAQAAVPVVVGDTEESLSARVLKAEHQLYPLALRMVAEGKALMIDGAAVFPGLDDGSGDHPGLVIAPQPLRAEIDLERLARITP